MASDASKETKESSRENRSDNKGDPNPTVALFQKAHQRMLGLQRLDEQIAAIFAQRRKLQEELKDIQSQINEEFDRVIRQADQAPRKLLAEVIAPRGGSGEGRMDRLEPAEEAA